MDKKSINNTVMCITNKNAINSFRSYFHFFFIGGGTATLAKHPHTRTYLLDGCRPLHNSYVVFSAFFLGTLFKR